MEAPEKPCLFCAARGLECGEKLRSSHNAILRELESISFNSRLGSLLTELHEYVSCPSQFPTNSVTYQLPTPMGGNYSKSSEPLPTSSSIRDDVLEILSNRFPRIDNPILDSIYDETTPLIEAQPEFPSTLSLYEYPVDTTFPPLYQSTFSAEFAIIDEPAYTSNFGTVMERISFSSVSLG